VFGNVEKVEKTQLIGVLPELRRVFGQCVRGSLEFLDISRWSGICDPSMKV